jgi:hypothetical protein
MINVAATRQAIADRSLPGCGRIIYIPPQY